MGKRYYCDYCDRSFQDNTHNRKKHLNGVQHHRAKKAWFDHFRDAAAVLTEEQTKKPCRKFIQTGQCVFGNNCRFSHMTKKDLDDLKWQIEGERQRREDPQSGKRSPDRSLEDWLARREKRKAALSSGSVLKEEAEEEDQPPPESHVPPHLLAMQDLPASLLPPPPATRDNAA